MTDKTIIKWFSKLLSGKIERSSLIIIDTDNINSHLFIKNILDDRYVQIIIKEEGKEIKSFMAVVIGEVKR